MCRMYPKREETPSRIPLVYWRRLPHGSPLVRKSTLSSTSFPHPPTSVPAPTPSFPHPPCHSCTHPRQFPHPPRHSREGGNPFRCVRRASIAIPSRTHRTDRIAFDKTELVYYSGTMTTQRNHTQRRQPQYAKYASCRTRHPAPQTVICPPIAAHHKRRCQTRRQQDPTEGDRMRRNATKTRARTREGRKKRSVSLLSSWIALRPQGIGRPAWGVAIS